MAGDPARLYQELYEIGQELLDALPRAEPEELEGLVRRREELIEAISREDSWAGTGLTQELADAMIGQQARLAEAMEARWRQEWRAVGVRGRARRSLDAYRHTMPNVPLYFDKEA